MFFLALALTLAPVAMGQGAAPEPEFAANPVFRAVLSEGLAVEGVTVKLPAPCLRDGMTDDERRAALKGVVDVPLDEFLRDSVNAPFKLKVRDIPYDGGIARVVDLWFAVHANLNEIDMDDLAGKKDRSGKGEAGNMSFSARTLTGDELTSHSKDTKGTLDRYAVSKGVLLDRIEVVTTNHVVGTKSPGSLVIASLTDHAFDTDKDLGNRWMPIPGPGEAKKDLGPPRRYVGSAGYSKISQFSLKPSILLVESHLVFVEPKAWFNGTSILRAKISLIAQDRIRQLRREIVARRKKEGNRPAVTP